jgi:ribose transport system ATP-binding protein
MALGAEPVTGSGDARTGAPGPVLLLEGISKAYPGTQALDDVTLDLLPGEVHCIIGENGAGKSTLMKILAGVVRPDDGRIVLAGEEYDHLTPRTALGLGIRTIYQDADLVSSLTVADNVFLGAEPIRGSRLVDTATQREVTGSVISDLGVALDPDRLVADLSPAQRQLTQIVRALRTEPRVLVLDEPTASLGQAEAGHLLELVRRLADRGIGIFYISHYLREVLEVGDRITVLKDGRRVETRPTAGSTPDDLASLMVGRSASAFFEKRHVEIGDVVMKVEGYSGPGIPEPVSFEVHRGEVLGFGGLVGAGRTELLQLIFGITRPRTGRLVMDGRAVRPHSPREAVAAGLALVTEDRALSGLFPQRTVRENISAAWNELRGPIVRGEQRLASETVHSLGVVTPSVEQEVVRLSGGNQQKVVIGRWLAVDAKVFLLDEPTRGVDIGAKHDIYDLIWQLLGRGKAVIVVSSDLPELLSLSDRIAIMRRGRIVGEVDARGATEQSLMRHFLGVADA